MLRTCLALGLAAALLAGPLHASRNPHEKDVCEPRGHRHAGEVQAAIQDFARAFSSGNPQQISAQWEVHGDLVEPGGSWLKGKMQIEKYFQDQYLSIFKGSKMALNPESIRFLNDTRVLMDAQAVIAGMHTLAGADLPPVKLRLSGVWHRHHDHWHLTALRMYAPGK